MNEYRLIYKWGATHCKAITGSDNAQGIVKYINNNLAEMQDYLDLDEDAEFRIKKYVNGDFVSEWYGTPEDLLGFMQEEA